MSGLSLLGGLINSSVLLMIYNLSDCVALLALNSDYTYCLQGEVLCRKLFPQHNITARLILLISYKILSPVFTSFGFKYPIICMIELYTIFF